MEYDYSYESVTTAISRRRPLITSSLPSSTTKDNHIEAGASASVASKRSTLSSEQSSSCHHQHHHHYDAETTTTSSSATTTLKRTLSLSDLIFYGVGCSVGAGIYSLVGIGAHLAGPGIAVSFLLCGLACCFTSLSYAEFAARVPLAGSAYTFTYVSFGELAGWLVGWNLTLGYAISASAVARSWAEYVVGFIEGLPWFVEQKGGEASSSSFATVLLRWSIHAPVPSWLGGDGEYDCCPLAAIIIALCTLILVTGAKESSRFNTAMTLLNLSILGFVVLAGMGSGTIHSDNLLPFFPQGIPGVGRAAGLVFFSYLGFDMVSCLSEEVINPEKSMPIGIIGSLVTSMMVYCSVSLVVVGMAPISLLGTDIPIVNALLANACCTHDEQLLQDSGSNNNSINNICLTYGCNPVHHTILYVGSRIVSFGAIFGLTTATFACLMGQPRIFYSMAQDGLLFKIYGKVHPQTGIPTMGTIITGGITALIACLVSLESLANVISLGTLQVFTFVNAGVIILRMTPPTLNHQQHRPEEDEKVPSSTIEMDIVTTTTATMVEHALGSGKVGFLPGDVIGAGSKIKDSNHHCVDDERSPLLPDKGGGAILINMSSREGRMVTGRHQGDVSSFTEGVTTTRTSATTTAAIGLEKNGSRPHWFTFGFTLCAILVSVSLSFMEEPSSSSSRAVIILIVSLLGTMMLWCTIMLLRLEQTSPPSTFNCPWVPIVPLMGIVCNSYMMGSMPLSTWVAVFLWLFIGLCFYFGYGMHHSKLRRRR